MTDKELKTESEFDKNSRLHFEKFMDVVIPDSDPITMILRCHLLVEFYLDRIITTNIRRGDIITDSRIQFFDKLVIVEALDILDKDLVDSVRKLNSVRNACSHVLDYKIVENDIDKIGNPLGKGYIELREEEKSDLQILLHRTLTIVMARLTGCVQGVIDAKIKKDQK